MQLVCGLRDSTRVVQHVLAPAAHQRLGLPVPACAHCAPVEVLAQQLRVLTAAG